LDIIQKMLSQAPIEELAKIEQFFEKVIKVFEDSGKSSADIEIALKSLDNRINDKSSLNQSPDSVKLFHAQCKYHIAQSVIMQYEQGTSEQDNIDIKYLFHSNALKYLEDANAMVNASH